MPYTHTPIFPGSKVNSGCNSQINMILIILQDKYLCLRACVYRTFRHHPQFTKVVTQSISSRRYAFLHAVLRGRIQPFIHTCNVTVIDKHGRHHNFCFAFKNHRDLPINRTVEALCPNTHWRGDIAILCTAVKFDGIVGMRAGDHKVADFALKKYVLFHCLSSKSLILPGVSNIFN